MASIYQVGKEETFKIISCHKSCSQSLLNFICFFNTYFPHNCNITNIGQAGTDRKGSFIFIVHVFVQLFKKMCCIFQLSILESTLIFPSFTIPYISFSHWGYIYFGLWPPSFHPRINFFLIGSHVIIFCLCFCSVCTPLYHSSAYVSYSKLLSSACCSFPFGDHKWRR